jgi:hypothetical protein
MWADCLENVGSSTSHSPMGPPRPVAAISLPYLFFPFGSTAPNSGLGLPPWNFPFHPSLLDLTQSVGLLGRVISSSQCLYPYTNTEKPTHTSTKHPCLEWDSNQRSRLPSERRQYMPYTARLPWPVPYLLSPSKCPHGTSSRTLKSPSSSFLIHQSSYHSML